MIAVIENKKLLIQYKIYLILNSVLLFKGSSISGLFTTVLENHTEKADSKNSI